MAKGAWKRLPQFEIAARTGPIPKKLVVNDLRAVLGAALETSRIGSLSTSLATGMASDADDHVDSQSAE